MNYLVWPYYSSYSLLTWIWAQPECNRWYKWTLGTGIISPCALFIFILTNNFPLSAYFSIIHTAHIFIDLLVSPSHCRTLSSALFCPGSETMEGLNKKDLRIFYPQKLSGLSFLVYHKFRLYVVMVGLMMILSVFQHQIKKYQKIIRSLLHRAHWAKLSSSCFITYGISYILSSRYLYIPSGRRK